MNMIVYKITNLLNGKIYVGQTIRTLKERFREHKYADSLIGKAIRKYGTENFKSEILSTCNSFEELNECEIFWIYELDCIAPKGYNRLEGGAHAYCNFISLNNVSILQMAIKAPPSALKVFLHLATRQPFEGGIKISKKAVADNLELSRTVVWQGFKWLKENNYIKERKVDGLPEFLLNPNVTTCGRKRKEKIKLWEETA